MGNDFKDGKRERSRVTVAMKRAPGELRVEHNNQKVRCRVFLHDITPGGVGLFCESRIDVDSKVELVIEVPKPLYLKARITWCCEAGTTSHVISAKNFAYRAGLEFIFDSKEAEEEFKRYCIEIERMAAS